MFNSLRSANKRQEEGQEREMEESWGTQGESGTSPGTC